MYIQIVKKVSTGFMASNIWIIIAWKCWRFGTFSIDVFVKSRGELR